MTKRVIHVSCRPSVRTKESHKRNVWRSKAKVSDIPNVSVVKGRSINHINNTLPNDSWNNNMNFILRREDHIPMQPESAIIIPQPPNYVLFPLSNDIISNMNLELKKKNEMKQSNNVKKNQSNNDSGKTGNFKLTYMCIFWYLFGIFIVILLSATIIIPLFVIYPKGTAQTVAPTQTSYVWNSTGLTVIAEPSSSPNALALDTANTIYVVENYKNRVQKYIIGSSTNITTVAGLASGISGAGPSSLNGPCDVVVDSSNNVYVLDQTNHRVQLWTSGASTGVTVAGIGGQGTNTSQLKDPYFMTINRNTGTLYIADTDNWRVIEYPSGASVGNLVAGGYGAGTSSNQLYNPSGIYFESSSNSLIIANVLGHNIVRWVLGASSWTLIAGSMNGTNGNTSTLLDHPMGLTLDPMGNIYVADSNNHRIQLFLAGQTSGITIAGINGVCGTDADKLCNPRAVALDAQLNLYVADTQNHRVQKFSHG